jgi:hypothetical protein
MSNHIVTPMKSHRAARARSLSALALPGPAGLGTIGAAAIKTHRVEHRNGAGHLDPAYAAQLRGRVQDRARRSDERAFVFRTSRADQGSEQTGEEFVMTVTGGDNGQAADDEDRSEEQGGPFVETKAGVEFAYDTDETNPADATREPFPLS